MTTDAFEAARRERETRNEVVIHTMLGLFTLLVIASQLLLARLPGAPPIALYRQLTVEGLATAVAAGVVLWLRRAPAYRPVRKYVLSIANVAIALLLGLASREMETAEIGLLLNVAIMMLLVALSGLRYSPPVVLVMGAAALATHLGLAATSPAGASRVAAAAAGSVLIVASTAVTHTVVRSLVRLHREALLSERLGRFFPPGIVAHAVARPEVLRDAVERDVVVVFIDISGFTEMSSGMTPAQVMDLLNAYFPVLVDTVFARGGTLEKYIGDALLAVWGAPLPVDDAADRAVRAALDAQAAMPSLNERLRARGLPAIAIHAGVHAGRVAAGTIGSERYLQYATIGDTTNTASRICGLAGSGEVVISQAVRERLTDPELELETLPPASVKGKIAPVAIHRVRARSSSRAQLPAVGTNAASNA